MHEAGAKLSELDGIPVRDAGHLGRTRDSSFRFRGGDMGVETVLGDQNPGDDTPV